MHTIYYTDAFVLDEKPVGEAGKLYTLFTRDLGLIRATAQGVRYEKSKLRFALSKFAKAHVALVQGKGGWRLTNAYADVHLYREIDAAAFRIVTRTFALMTRLIQGEEPNPALFGALNEAVNFLMQYEAREGETAQLTDIECVIVLRILNTLGYIGDHKDITFFVLDNALKDEHIEAMQQSRAKVLKEINRALKESQL